MIASDTAIQVRGLTRIYRGKGTHRVVANDDLSFSIARGQVFGLLGANGAGKTTLVQQLLGLVAPTSGSITVEGIDVVRDPAAVRTVTGFLPQTGLAMRLIEVRRALHYTGRLRGQSEVDARRQAAELIEELGLGGYADRYVDKLSGGMMRLVNIGMALMGRPKVLILDEPTNELDPVNRKLVWDAFSRRSVLEGTTVVLVTHNVLEAEKAVHRVAVMSAGRIIAIGTPGELKGRLGERTRLELSVRDGGELDEHELAKLALAGEVTRGSRSGSYLIQALPDRVPELVEVVTGDLGLRRVDDFRLARPTLEDVYLALNGEQQEVAVAASERAGTADAPPPASVEAAVDDTPAPEPVPSPRKSARERIAGGLTHFKYLWLEQMLEVRTTWPWTLVLGLLMPIAMVFGLSRIGGGLDDPTSLLYIVSGAAVFAVATEGIATLAQRIGAIKTDGMMLYYASLPIGKTPFIAALVLSRLIIVMPGLLTPIVAGKLFYDVDFVISPALLLVIPLAALAVSALGMAIGSLVDSLDLIVVITNLIIFVLLLASPVLIPAESLPLPLQLLGYLMPPTYAADALRLALSGEFGFDFTVDVLVLACMALFGLAAASRWIRWRTS